MSLNIKNPAVHALARDAARRTGRSQTSVIEEALRAYLAGLGVDESDKLQRVDQRLADLAVVVADMDAVLSDDDRAAIRRDMEQLYDSDTGLPR